jgi:dihydrofolate reductase
VRGLIYAVSPEGVIGANGTLPWRHPGDTRRFKRITLGTTVIMGRATFESMGRALPKRRNIVVTSHVIGAPDIECVPSLHEAVDRAGSSDTWFIGGARIFAEGMSYADLIDVTYVPDHVGAEGAVYAPPIDETAFEPGPLLPHEDEPGLTRRMYTRRPGVPRA